jgi:voltage-gated potassium channel
MSPLPSTLHFEWMKSSMQSQTNTRKPLQQRVFSLLFDEQNPHGMHASVTRWSTLLILLNVLAMVLETADAFEAAHATELAAFEALSVMVFTIEYLLRWFSAPADPEFANSRFARLSYVGSRYAIIDLLAIAPFYLASFVSLDLRLLRLLRLLRVFKVTSTLLPAIEQFKLNTVGMTRRQKVHALMFASDKKQEGLPLMIDLFLIFWIAISTLSIVLESVDSIRTNFEIHFFILDTIAFCLFTVEYALRMYASAENDSANPMGARWKFGTSFSGLIDLVSILPFILEILFSQLIDLRFLRIVRLVRLLKLSRYNKSTSTLFLVIRRELPVLAASSFIMMMLVFITAAMGYLLERGAQPDKFEDIPTSMYWAVVTLASVGYGDITPVTPAGRLLTVLLALVGIGVFAIPAAIMSSAFTDQLRVEREEALKEKQQQDNGWRPPELLQTNPDFALARYRTLLNQMREVAALSDHALISQRLADEGSSSERQVWQSLKNR